MLRLDHPGFKLRAVWIAAAAVAVAWSPGGVYFLQMLAGVDSGGPIWIYGTIVASLLLILAFPSSRETRFAAFFFAVLIAYVCLTALWSPSIEYLEEKLYRTLLIPPLFLVAGYLVARSGGVPAVAVALSVYALIIFAATWFVPPNYLLNASSSDPLNYQRYGLLMGAGAAAAILLTNRSLAGYVFFVVFLVLSAACLMSGGRTGIPVIACALFVRVWPVKPSVVVLALAAMIPIIIFRSEIGTWMLENVDQESSIFRAVDVTFGSGADASVTRGDLIGRAWDVFLDNPFFGVGWGGFPSTAGFGDILGYYPHNLILELLAETGIVGLALLIIFIYPIVRRFSRSSHSTRLIWLFFLVGFIVAMLIGDFQTQTMMFAALGMMTGASDSVVKASHHRQDSVVLERMSAAKVATANP